MPKTIWFRCGRHCRLELRAEITYPLYSSQEIGNPVAGVVAVGLGPCKSGNFGGSDFFTEALDAFELAGRPPARAHCMNLIGIFILTALIFEFVVEGGGKLRQLAARNCDTGSISDPLSIFLSIENLCFSASSSDWQRRRFFLPPGLAQTVALAVGLYDVTPVGQAV